MTAREGVTQGNGILAGMTILSNVLGCPRGFVNE